eukprot:GHVQ01013046.1.p1 GENE.GHVQ01013046.1~~GHVQ01013046.1.p1  ORF type:complete len:260 (-),score=21.95 GHVQ01013046.1:3100-3879(-)
MATLLRSPYRNLSVMRLSSIASHDIRHCHTHSKTVRFRCALVYGEKHSVSKPNYIRTSCSVAIPGYVHEPSLSLPDIPRGMLRNLSIHTHVSKLDNIPVNGSESSNVNKVGHSTKTLCKNELSRSTQFIGHKAKCELINKNSLDNICRTRLVEEDQQSDNHVHCDMNTAVYIAGSPTEAQDRSLRAECNESTDIDSSFITETFDDKKNKKIEPTEVEDCGSMNRFPKSPIQAIEYGYKYEGPEPTRYGDWAHKGRVTDF